MSWETTKIKILKKGIPVIAQEKIAYIQAQSPNTMLLIIDMTTKYCEVSYIADNTILGIDITEHTFQTFEKKYSKIEKKAVMNRSTEITFPELNKKGFEVFQATISKYTLKVTMYKKPKEG
jgi:hypothetical protein